MSVDYYDLKSLTSVPNWKEFREQSAAYGIIPILQNMGPDIKGIEVGVCLGVNSYILLEMCPNISLIVGIDHYKAYKDWDREIQQYEQDYNFNKLKNNMEYIGPRFSLIREESIVAAKELDNESFDFVFIDADHNMKAVLNDLDNYWPKIKSGGIMAGHDSNLFGVNFAVTSWCKRKNIEPSAIVNTINDAWWFTKP